MVVVVMVFVTVIMVMVMVTVVVVMVVIVMKMVGMMAMMVMVTMTEGRRNGTRKGVEVMDVARHSARGPSYMVANREENDGGFTGF